MSALECLNLNITLPDVDKTEKKPLPVMVFIHGGEFLMGANSWPHYNMARLVHLSAKSGFPVIGVNIKLVFHGGYS